MTIIKSIARGSATASMCPEFCLLAVGECGLDVGPEILEDGVIRVVLNPEASRFDVVAKREGRALRADELDSVLTRTVVPGLVAVTITVVTASTD